MWTPRVITHNGDAVPNNYIINVELDIYQLHDIHRTAQTQQHVLTAATFLGYGLWHSIYPRTNHNSALTDHCPISLSLMKSSYMYHVLLLKLEDTAKQSPPDWKAITQPNESHMKRDDMLLYSEV